MIDLRTSRARDRRWRRTYSLAVAVSTIMPVSAMAQARAEDALISQLRQGGFVLVMRHASSPRERPTKKIANPDNTTLERQLDEAGRRGATTMGVALRALHIPIGNVWTSPTYRGRETVRLAGLPAPSAVDELGDGGQSMQGVTDVQAEWLRAKASEAPTSGNVLLVTHLPNLSRAFPDWGSTVADGEVVVLRPNGRGGSDVVGHIPIERWGELE